LLAVGLPFLSTASNPHLPSPPPTAPAPPQTQVVSVRATISRGIDGAASTAAPLAAALAALPPNAPLVGYVARFLAVGNDFSIAIRRSEQQIIPFKVSFSTDAAQKALR
jgi:hypothetical protein